MYLFFSEIQTIFHASKRKCSKIMDLYYWSDRENIKLIRTLETFL